MYRLIWKNTIESCMANAVYTIILAKISAPLKLEYRYTCEDIVFAGWKIIDLSKNTKDESVLEDIKRIAYNYLPKLKNR